MSIEGVLELLEESLSAWPILPLLRRRLVNDFLRDNDGPFCASAWVSLGESATTEVVSIGFAV